MSLTMENEAQNDFISKFALFRFPAVNDRVLGTRVKMYTGSQSGKERIAFQPLFLFFSICKSEGGHLPPCDFGCLVIGRFVDGILIVSELVGVL